VVSAPGRCIDAEPLVVRTQRQGDEAGGGMCAVDEASTMTCTEWLWASAIVVWALVLIGIGLWYEWRK